ALANAAGEFGSTEAVTNAPLAGRPDTNCRDITEVARGSQSRRPLPVKFRARLIVHADLQQGRLRQRASRELETRGETRLARAVHDEQRRKTAQVGGPC